MKLIGFDIDGTVLDTLDTIMFHLNESLHENGFYRIDDREYVRQSLGFGSRYLVERALIFPYNHIYDKNLTTEILDYYTKRYNSNSLYLTKAYDGIVDLIKKLREKGCIVVAYSNKPDIVLKSVLDNLFGEEIFDFALGYKEGAKTKPDATEFVKLLDHYKVEKKDAVYIGDSEIDIQTGKNAGVKTIGVTWGFRNKDFLMAQKADYLVDSVEELSELLERME